jgi:hypothetical protein
MKKDTCHVLMNKVVFVYNRDEISIVKTENLCVNFLRVKTTTVDCFLSWKTASIECFIH